MTRFLIPMTLGLLAVANSASAATCANRADVVNALETRFNETLSANAISPSNNVLEVYTSPGSETWSILVFLPDRGLSCLAATGKGERELELALGNS